MLKSTLNRFMSKLGFWLLSNQFKFAETAENESKLQEIPRLERLSDEQLNFLNNLLPWASYNLDSKGRVFGKPFSHKKRRLPESIPDTRLVDFNSRFSILNKRVLELGCFEGHHTIGLCMLGAKVTALDARVEHIVKTIIRSYFFSHYPEVICFDLERGYTNFPNDSYDAMVHIGVLYHLSDPVKHLKEVLGNISQAVLLDTHYATESMTNSQYKVDNYIYKFYKFKEHGLSAPFAGTKPHAKWLLVEDIIKLLHEAGFNDISVIEKRQERNGPRVLLHAFRSSLH